MIPSSFIPAVEKGVGEAMDSGVLVGYPVKGVRVKLFDAPAHRRLLGDRLQAGRRRRDEAGLGAGRPGAAGADHAGHGLGPGDGVGDVIGDLDSRRGRPQGMEPAVASTEIKASNVRDRPLRPRPALHDRRPGRLHDGSACATQLPAHLARKIIDGPRESALRRTRRSLTHRVALGAGPAPRRGGRTCPRGSFPNGAATQSPASSHVCRRGGRRDRERCSTCSPCSWSTLVALVVMLFLRGRATWRAA